MLLPPLLGGLGPPEGGSLIPAGLLLCWPHPGAWGPPFFGDTTTSPLVRDTRGPGLPDQALRSVTPLPQPAAEQKLGWQRVG